LTQNQAFKAVKTSRPADEYRARLERRRDEHAAWTRRDARFAYARLVVFAVFILLLVLAIRAVVPAAWLLVPVAAFVVLVQRHDRVIRRRDDAARAIAFYERGLARIEDRWIGTGERGERFRDDHHPYAHDLDLFGEGSLFELLSIARTGAGEETLAAWLKAPAEPHTIASRQQAVTELTGALDLREALGRAGSDVREGVHTEALLGWAEGPVLLSPVWLRWVAALFAPLVVVGIVLFLTTGEERLLVAVLVAQTLFVWPQLGRTEHALHGAEGVTRDLDVLAHLLERLEREHFTAPRLVELRQQLRTGGVDASRAIHALHRLVEIYEWQHNLMFLMLSLPFLVGTHLAWAIESWRTRYGRDIREWLGAAGEFEALASFSAYRYEHPDDPFPVILDDRPARFEGESLGHPLLASARMVRNDVRLDATTRLLVVSGSNMSGKSTLLRTAGINTVLALAGAPVRAHALTLSPLAIGATLRIQDSLQEGRSRFYAEITRIRELADLARGPRPLLFLLDELFHGTNSHDRLIGASGVLRSLLERGAIGLITTHDLALTAIADELAPRAINVHFEDWFEGGEMRFDYRVKPGRVTRSNALALMRAVGLEVDS
jgi:hypothetical protein